MEQTFLIWVVIIPDLKRIAMLLSVREGCEGTCGGNQQVVFTAKL